MDVRMGAQVDVRMGAQVDAMARSEFRFEIRMETGHSPVWEKRAFFSIFGRGLRRVLQLTM